MKHSDKKQTFETGANRDTDDNKGNPSLIGVIGSYRLAILLQKGAKHYGPNNWQKGMPFLRTINSITRHLWQYTAMDDSEDHLAAIRFGVDCLMHFEEAIKADELPPSLDDREDQRKILTPFLTSLEGDTTIQQKEQLKNSSKKEPIRLFCSRCEVWHPDMVTKCPGCGGILEEKEFNPAIEKSYYGETRCCGNFYSTHISPDKIVNRLGCDHCGKELNYVKQR